MLEDNNLKNQDESILHGISNNYIGRRLAFNYITENWNNLLER